MRSSAPATTTICSSPKGSTSVSGTDESSVVGLPYAAAQMRRAASRPQLAKPRMVRTARRQKGGSGLTS
eukprot:11506163-Alexandrium_andersonii.AAC.1